MADQRAQYNEAAVGANHPTLADTVNRLTLVEHNNDGTHKPVTKATPVDADIVLGQDSAASFGLIKATWANVKAFLKTYFDAIYSPIAGSSSIITVGNITSGTWNGTIIANATHATSADSATTANSASTASLLTNSVAFNTSGGASPGASFNGSSTKTIDYSTVGAAALAGGSTQPFSTASLSVYGVAGINNNANPSPPIATLSGTTLYVHGASPGNSRIVMQGYGTSSGQFTGVSFGGTIVSPAAVTANTVMAGFGGLGTYDTSGNMPTATRASVNFLSSELWSATNQGTHIEFRTTTNGATSASIKAFILNNGNVTVGAAAYTTDTGEKLQVTGQIAATSSIKTGVFTVATLPTGSTGARAFVSDATATTFASIVAGTGANGVPVYHDGTNWRIG